MYFMKKINMFGHHEIYNQAKDMINSPCISEWNPSMQYIWQAYKVVPPSVLSWFVSHLTSSLYFPINWSYFNQLGLHRSPINLMNSLYINHLQITCFSGDWLNHHLRQLRRPWSGLAATDGPFEVPSPVVISPWKMWFKATKLQN